MRSAHRTALVRLATLLEQQHQKRRIVMAAAASGAATTTRTSSSSVYRARVRALSSSSSAKTLQPSRHASPFSSLAVATAEYDDDDDDDDFLDKHCTTCTCDSSHTRLVTTHRNNKPHHVPRLSPPPLRLPLRHRNRHDKSKSKNLAPQDPPLPDQSHPHHHHHDHHQNSNNNDDDLPPPLPEPKYSVRRRVLPDQLCALSSARGKQMLIHALVTGTAAAYLPLTEHFDNQSDPAYCGVTTLLTVLNALAVDPGVRWKGGWRYFGSEDVLLTQCTCLVPERIRRVGISMEEFAQLGTCQGLQVTMKRAHAAVDDDEAPPGEDDDAASLEEFRHDIVSMLQEDTAAADTTEASSSSIPHPAGIVVVSFSRAALGQTGDGHFSPVAAYHAPTDQVLILDVARFKYQPYWVDVPSLYEAMKPVDVAGTGKSRGWYVLHPPAVSSASGYKGMDITTEERRPAGLVPLIDSEQQQQEPGVSLCPIHPIKVDYCANNFRHNNNDNNHNHKRRR